MYRVFCIIGHRRKIKDEILPLRRPFADPSLTLRRPFADPSQTLRRPFADPSHKLRASAQGFGSGLRLWASAQGQNDKKVGLFAIALSDMKK